MYHAAGRPGNSIGMKVVGGMAIPDTGDVGAFVATIFRGGVADQTHGEVKEGTATCTRVTFANMV